MYILTSCSSEKFIISIIRLLFSLTTQYSLERMYKNIKRRKKQLGCKCHFSFFSSALQKKQQKKQALRCSDASITFKLLKHAETNSESFPLISAREIHWKMVSCAKLLEKLLQKLSMRSCLNKRFYLNQFIDVKLDIFPLSNTSKDLFKARDDELI